MIVHLEDLTLLSSMPSVCAAESWRIHAEVDPNSESQVKEVIRKHVVPDLEKEFVTHPGFRDRLKECLRYFLNKKQFPFERIFEAREPSLVLPDDPLNYYRWAWDVLFGPEDYRLESLEGYSEGPPVAPLPSKRRY